MNWERRSYPSVGQDVWITQATAIGPEVIVIPKPGLQRKYATFSTRYGSNERRFALHEGGAVEIPAGTAHFLEHQLFDQPEKNVLQELSALGVNPNAYTGRYYTVYLISAVERWLEAFARLLEFV